MNGHLSRNILEESWKKHIVWFLGLFGSMQVDYLGNSDNFELRGKKSWFLFMLEKGDFITTHYLQEAGSTSMHNTHDHNL